jgi:NADH-quinone oxidoreductase subunit J
MILFYIAAAVALASTVMVITRVEPVHALLYFIVSLFAVAVIFYLLGAPFVAALEVIIYAGAIMVLFLFLVMLLNLGPTAAAQERAWLPRGIWAGPVLLALVLAAELGYILTRSPLPAGSGAEATVIPPRAVGIALFGPYLIGVEIAGLLLLAGLVGAFHLGRRERGAADAEVPPAHASRPHAEVPPARVEAPPAPVDVPPPSAKGDPA